MKKDYFFTNQEVADLLRKVASAYTVKNANQFRIRAYEEAAVSAEHSTAELKDLWDDGKLNQVPGFGKNITKYVSEFFEKGEVRHFERLFASLPGAMFIFEKIPGIGPKTAFSLARNLKISREKMAIEKLKKAALAGKIRLIERFGEKSEEEILKGIESLEKGELKEVRMPLYQADALANEIINYLKKSSFVIEAHPLGSLRRMLATIGDVDISVSTKEPKKVMNYIFNYPKIKRVLGKGEEALARIILKNGRQVDIRLSLPENYGSMLQYFTGSKQHNISLREFALKKGLSLSEYGIKTVKNSKTQSYAREEDFYHDLGLEWIPPELREDTGEIEAALRQAQGKPGGLPKLLELTDIKGDLHLHSNFPIEPSHDIGESSMEEMVQMAENLGYEYIAFGEHNPSVSKHSPKQIEELIKEKKEYIGKIIYSCERPVKNGVKKLPVKIFNSLEVDINPSGEIALPENCFNYVDFVIASVHSVFDMDRKKMTKRIINGISHPKVKILGHPTGRKIGEREGFEIDWDELFNFCLKNGKILEISAWPNRLDLPDTLVHEAVRLGVKLAINSDSHSVTHMDLMRYGVAVGRRGWAEKKDIINTLPYRKISDILLRS